MSPTDSRRRVAAGRRWLRSYINGCGSKVWKAPIHSSLQGKTFSEAAEWAYRTAGFVLIGTPPFLAIHFPPIFSLCVCAFVHACIHLFLRMSTHPFRRICLFIHPTIHPFTHPLTLPSIHISIQFFHTASLVIHCSPHHWYDVPQLWHVLSLAHLLATGSQATCAVLCSYIRCCGET